MTGIEIVHADTIGEFITAERCYIAETWNSSEDPALSIAQARLEPGVTTAWHWLDGVIERYRVLAGRGRVEVGELPASVVGPGDVVVIPAGVRQRISNIGTEDLLFDCLCTPRFTTGCYHSMEG
jgi:mannose-6-phosphate isomerase-like protein (cupin superfamily)